MDEKKALRLVTVSGPEPKTEKKPEMKEGIFRIPESVQSTLNKTKGGITSE